MNTFSILGRYTIRQLLGSFFTVLFAVLGIILMFDSIEALRQTAGHEDVTVWFIIQFAVTRITKTVELVLPFVMMIAAMITFWRLSKSNEFVIIRAAGVSMFGFLKPLMIATFVLGILNVTLFNPLAAKMFEWHEILDYRLETRNPNAVLFSSKGLWIREAVGDDKILLVQAKSLVQKNEQLWMKDVSITELDKNSQINKVYEAFFGTLDGNVLQLKDVKVLVGGQAIEYMNEYSYNTSIDLQRIKENFIEPNAISFWQLPDTISFYEKAGFSAKKHWMRFLSILISPFLLVGMVMIAAIFMLQNTQRGSGILLRVVLSIVTGFVVYFSSQVVYAFGVNGYIPVWLSVSAPTLIILLTSSSLLISADEV